MSRGFYRVVLCAFAARENGGLELPRVRGIVPLELPLG